METKRTTRDAALQSAIYEPATKEIAPGFTVRKPTLQDEYIFSLTGTDVLSPEFLAAAASGKNSVLTTRPVLNAIFICSRPAKDSLAAARAGTETFDECVFAWLATRSREDVASAAAWLLGCVSEIAAASFNRIARDFPERAAPKNTPSPAAPHS